MAPKNNKNKKKSNGRKPRSRFVNRSTTDLAVFSGRRKFKVALNAPIEVLASGQTATRVALTPYPSASTTTLPGIVDFVRTFPTSRLAKVDVHIDQRGQSSANIRTAALILPGDVAEITTPPAIAAWGGAAVSQMSAKKNYNFRLGPEFDVGRFNLATTADSPLATLFVYTTGFAPAPNDTIPLNEVDATIRIVSTYETDGPPSFIPDGLKESMPDQSTPSNVAEEQDVEQAISELGTDL